MTKKELELIFDTLYNAKNLLTAYGSPDDDVMNVMLEEIEKCIIIIRG